MKSTFLPLTFISLACNNPKAKDNYNKKPQSTNMDERLIGVWISYVNDEATKNSIGNVTMTFTNDGSFIYDIDEGGKLQRMNMTYRIDGDTIISDQPSHPSEQKTKYKLETDNRLILEFDGTATVFTRKGE